MSALERLKAKIAYASAVPFVGSVGDQGTHVSEIDDPASVGFVGGSRTPVSVISNPDQAIVGSAGDQGMGVSGFQTETSSENPIPHPPTEPTEVTDYQTNMNACWICSGRETVGRMFLAVCSDIPGRHHWMHADCWPKHVQRCTAQREGSPS